MSCKCQGCGNQYRIDIGVPDEIWERIQPSGKAVGAGLLCGSCIVARLEAMGVYGSYELVESGSYIPQQPQCKTGKGWQVSVPHRTVRRTLVGCNMRPTIL